MLFSKLAQTLRERPGQRGGSGWLEGGGHRQPGRLAPADGTWDPPPPVARHSAW